VYLSEARNVVISAITSKYQAPDFLVITQYRYHQTIVVAISVETVKNPKKAI